MSRLQRAMARLVDTDGTCESVRAKRWVNAWSGAIGETYFDGAERAILLARKVKARSGPYE